jgi:hypothetical protein
MTLGVGARTRSRATRSSSPLMLAGSQVRRSYMTARETLDHRLVNGEITSEQYDELRKKLDAPAPASG